LNSSFSNVVLNLTPPAKSGFFKEAKAINEARFVTFVAFYHLRWTSSSIAPPNLWERARIIERLNFFGG